MGSPCFSLTPPGLHPSAAHKIDWISVRSPPCNPSEHRCRSKLRTDFVGDIDWIGRVQQRRPLPRLAVATVAFFSSCKCIYARQSVSRFQQTLDEHYFLLSPVVCQIQFAENFRRHQFEIGAGRSKAKRGRGSGGRIEGPGSVARHTRKQIDPQKVKKGNAIENSSRNRTGKKTSGSGIPSENSLDPNKRQPDAYYKYGPYGPYGDMARVVGKPRKGTFLDMLAVTFSPVKDMEEFEERARHNATISYLRSLSRFDEAVGAQYFFAFVRQPREKGFQVPWKEWTLVAHVAVESAEELDKWTLGFRLYPKTRDAITQCTAWFRPDLVYVKKPKYQLRLEPLEKFLEALIDLLDPGLSSQGSARRYFDNDAQESSTFYGKFCKLLGVNLHASEDDVSSSYENLDEEGKLACLEHLLCNNPVELLHPFTRARMEEDRKLRSMESSGKAMGTPVHEDLLSKKTSGISELSNDEVEEEEDEGWSEEELFQESEGEGNKWLEEERFLIDEASEEMDEVEWDEKFQQTIKALSEKENDGPLDSDSDLDGDIHGVARDDKVDASENASAPLLKAAVRPFTYRDLVKEVVILHQSCVKERSVAALE